MLHYSGAGVSFVGAGRPMLHTFLNPIQLVLPNWNCDEAAGSRETGMPDLRNFSLVFFTTESGARPDVNLRKCESTPNKGTGLAAETQTRENERRCTYYYLLDLDLGE